MTSLRLALGLTVTLLLTACSPEDESAKRASAGHNALLDHVPSDSPYVFANLEPVPDALLDGYLEKMQPVAEELQAELERARSDLEDAQGDPAAMLALAVVQELDGNLSRVGLEALGIDLTARTVFYGDGALPVFRMQLSDAETLRATVNRVMTRSGVEFSERDYQGTGYWRITDPDNPDMPVAMYVSILPTQLAFGVSPLAEEAQWLPRFLGAEMPAASDAEERLKGINAEYGYTTYGTGVIDTRRMVDQFLDADGSLGGMLASSGEFDPAAVTDVCRAEIYEMTDQVPQMVMGVTELESSKIGSEFRALMPETLSSRLLKLAARLPLAPRESTALAEFSLGLKVGAARDFLREQAQLIVDDPYQCDYFADLNTRATQLLERMNQPMPPFVNNFRGLRVRLNEVPTGQAAMDQAALAQDSRGLMALHVEKPEMLVGMGQMFLPDLANLSLVAGEPPVRLPPSVIPIEGAVSYAAMTGRALGISMGEGEEAGLPEFLAASDGPDGVMLSANYDASRYAELTSGWTGDSAGDPAAAERGQALQDALGEAYDNMLDRAYVEMKFTDDGFVISSQTTLK